MGVCRVVVVVVVVVARAIVPPRVARCGRRDDAAGSSPVGRAVDGARCESARCGIYPRHSDAPTPRCGRSRWRGKTCGDRPRSSCDDSDRGTSSNVYRVVATLTSAANFSKRKHALQREVSAMQLVAVALTLVPYEHGAYAHSAGIQAFALG